MISIIIPAYNAERTIERCLASIFAQTYRDFEVVVVDDGSTDSTRKSLQNFSCMFIDNSSQFTVIEQENRGAQAARNRGWEECRMQNVECRMILFCDADIVLRADCLEKMVRTLEQNPEVSYAYSSFRFGWKKFKLWPFDAARLKQMPYIHTTSLIRAEHFPETGWDENVKRLQDWDLWLTMLEDWHTGVWVPEVLFTVINTKGTMSRWIPSFCYKIPKWLGIHPKAVTRYNEAVERIKAKHGL